MKAGGVTATVERTRLSLHGMSCAACATRIESRLNRLSGVQATVNYSDETATVAYDPRSVAVDDLIHAVEAAGYEAALPSDRAASPARGIGTRLVVAVALSLPVVVLSMVGPLQFAGWEWVALVLATPVVLGCGWPFHRAALRAARHRAATMDTLVSIGTFAAWGWSVVVLLAARDGHLYFEVAAVITTLILLGRWLEQRARRRSGRRSKRCSSSPRRTRGCCATVGRSSSLSVSSRSASWSSCARASESPPTASSSRARRRLTRRC